MRTEWTGALMRAGFGVPRDVPVPVRLVPVVAAVACSPRSPMRVRRSGWVLLLTAMLSVLTMLLGPGQAGASVFIPSPTVYLPSVYDVGWAETVGIDLMGTGTSGTLAGGAATSVAAPAAVIAGGLMIGYAVGTLAWRLGTRLGEIAPCFTCPAVGGGASPPPQGVIGSDRVGYFVDSTNAQMRYKAAYGGDLMATLNAAPSGAIAGSYRITGTASCGDCFVLVAGVLTSITSRTLTVQTVDGQTGAGIYQGNGTIDYVFNWANSTTPGSSTSADPTVPLGAVGSSTCRPAGSIVTYTRTNVGAMFHEVSVTSDVRPVHEVPIPPCSPGDTRVGYSATVMPLDSAGAPNPAGKTTPIVGPWTAPTVAPLDIPEGARCLPGGADYPCRLVLTKTAVDGSTRTYNAAVDWPLGSLTAAGMSLAPDSPPWSCAWGPLVAAVSQCSTIYGPAPVSAPSPTSSPDNCDGAGFSFNPVSWVVVPLKCLFVPSAGQLQTAYATVQTGWGHTGISEWATAVGSVGNGLAGLGVAGASGCGGPHFAFTLSGHSYSFDPLNACSQPMRGVAFVVHLFATIAVVVAGARMCARPLMAAIGMGQAV